MISRDDIKKIKEATEEFFSKMTLSISVTDVALSSDTKEVESNEADEKKRDVIDLSIKADEPQILIGQSGQTLFEIQRILRMILTKKFESIFYLNLDINDYKKKKNEYLKNLARDLANETALSKQEKSLPPMPAYERRIIHSELSNRTDVITESRGDGLERHIIIKPR